jgi:hypothetical protein
VFAIATSIIIFEEATSQLVSSYTNSLREIIIIMIVQCQQCKARLSIIPSSENAEPSDANSGAKEAKSPLEESFFDLEESLRSRSSQNGGE